MEAGKMVKLKVDRESDIAYILSNGNKEEEVFLHFNECAGKTLHVGEMVNVFLFFDNKARLAATLYTPKIDVFDCGWVDVVDVVPFGVYMNIGIRKDILFSGDDLPLNKALWPQKGDVLYGYLLNDHDKGLLFRSGSVNDYLEIKKEAPKDVYGTKVTATVIKLGGTGINVFTEEGYLGFIHNSEYKEEPRLGGKITARVINVKSNGEINCSLKPQKELAIDEDYEAIIAYLEGHLGHMPLCDKSTPEEIDNLLNMSKAAFKRAIGRLIREGKIEQNLDRKITTLKQN